ncbi:20S proteasome subunit beta 4 isoform A [Micractinium conductrix]|uniref:20S proteasome subunit beta 4 isoform A n=1 Tax=Micractinium conductrix TaxID=554055 RepID=A0A2P6V594_9CHLO|nr:20S proteasome subunit beta 4 isoform A [Micractinium conductrix]|eukprot:PSC69252.1 20S proteasome subunit beta 4 isoform A [Micractinium conductrix]
MAEARAWTALLDLGERAKRAAAPPPAAPPLDQRAFLSALRELEGVSGRWEGRLRMLPPGAPLPLGDDAEQLQELLQILRGCSLALAATGHFSQQRAAAAAVAGPAASCRARSRAALCSLTRPSPTGGTSSSTPDLGSPAAAAAAGATAEGAADAVNVATPTAVAARSGSAPAAAPTAAGDAMLDIQPPAAVAVMGDDTRLLRALGMLAGDAPAAAGGQFAPVLEAWAHVQAALLWPAQSDAAMHAWADVAAGRALAIEAAREGLMRARQGECAYGVARIGVALTLLCLQQAAYDAVPGQLPPEGGAQALALARHALLEVAAVGNGLNDFVPAFENSNTRARWRQLQAATAFVVPGCWQLPVLEDPSEPLCSCCRAVLFQVRRCSSCRVASYCSRDCQMRHWRAAHRWQCASLAALRNAAQQGGRAARAQAAAGPAVGGGGGEGDGRAPPKAQQAVRVQFQIPKQTAFGETVCIVGSFTGPQPWDPRAPVRLAWSEGARWTAEVEVPAGGRVEYKYVVVKERTGELLCWQPGGNLELDLGAGVEAVLVSDDWAGELHDVKPLAEEASRAGPAAVSSVPAELAHNSNGAAAAAVEAAAHEVAALAPAPAAPEPDAAPEETATQQREAAAALEAAAAEDKAAAQQAIQQREAAAALEAAAAQDRAAALRGIASAPFTGVPAAAALPKAAAKPAAGSGEEAQEEVEEGQAEAAAEEAGEEVAAPSAAVEEEDAAAATQPAEEEPLLAAAVQPAAVEPAAVAAQPAEAQPSPAIDALAERVVALAKPAPAGLPVRPAVHPLLRFAQALLGAAVATAAALAAYALLRGPAALPSWPAVGSMAASTAATLAVARRTLPLLAFAAEPLLAALRVRTSFRL